MKTVKAIVVALVMACFDGSAFAIGLPAPDATGKIVLDVANGQYAATDNGRI